MTPLARLGAKIVANVEAANLDGVIVTVSAPDTVLLSGEKTVIVPPGILTEIVEWSVVHVQKGVTASVEVKAVSGDIVQMGICRIGG